MWCSNSMLGDEMRKFTVLMGGISHDADRIALMVYERKADVSECITSLEDMEKMLKQAHELCGQVVEKAYVRD